MSTQKKTVTGRFDPDTYSRFEEYRKKRDLNKSTAARRLVERGLDEIETDDKDNDDGAESTVPLLLAMVLMGFALGWFVAGPLPAVAITLAAVVGYGGGTVIGPYLSTVAQNRREAGR